MEKIIDTAALTDQLKILLWDRSKTREELAELVIGLIDEAGEEINIDAVLGAWIPVEKMLPKTNGRFMVTIKSRRKCRTEMRTFDAVSQKWESNCWFPENIIAWRQRPAPYRHKSERERRDSDG